MCTQIGKLTATLTTQTTTSTDYTNTDGFGDRTQSAFEKTLITLKSDICTLTDEVAMLRNEMLAVSESRQSTSQHLDAKLNDLNKLWHNNLDSMKDLNQQVDATCARITEAHISTTDVFNSIEETKQDLMKWANSIFCREDSDRIKEIHAHISSVLLTQHESSYRLRTNNSMQDAMPTDNWIHGSRLFNNDFPPIRRERNTGTRNMDDPSRRPPVVNVTYSSKLPRSGHSSSTVPKQESTIPSRSSQSRSEEVTSPAAPVRQFVTLLITDSMMKNMNKDDLGVNHSLSILRKTDSSGLLHRDLREEMKKLRPDNVYVHLGINDIFNDKPITDIITNYCNFIMFRDEHLPNTKIIFSYPLLTGNGQHNSKVRKLHSMLRDLMIDIDDTKGLGPGSLKDDSLLVNTNSNFAIRDDLFAADDIHLTEIGCGLIRANLRCCIHAITRSILGKPKRVASRRRD